MRDHKNIIMKCHLNDVSTAIAIIILLLLPYPVRIEFPILFWPAFQSCDIIYF